MDGLGTPIALLGSVIGAFSLITGAVDRLNGYRDLVIDISDRARPLTPEHREMYLKHNFDHLLAGLLSFCLILTALVVMLPELVLPDVTGKGFNWTRASAYAIGVFIFGATVSICVTALKDRKRMKKYIQFLRDGDTPIKTPLNLQSAPANHQSPITNHQSPIP